MSRHQLVLARITSIASMGLILLAGVSGCPSNPSKSGKTPIQVQVSVASDGMPVVTPEEIRAREKDKVHWVFQGRDAKEFAVKFTSAVDSPFEWSEQKGASVTGTIKSGAAKGGKRTDYKYSVDVEGKVKDPKIIVDP
jgi:hypothetical protein